MCVDYDSSQVYGSDIKETYEKHKRRVRGRAKRGEGIWGTPLPEGPVKLRANPYIARVHERGHAPLAFLYLVC